MTSVVNSFDYWQVARNAKLYCRLTVAKSLAFAPILVEELLNFPVKITESANETFGTWREGRHDDLVLAIARAAWAAEHAPQAEIKVWFGPEDCRVR